MMQQRVGVVQVKLLIGTDLVLHAGEERWEGGGTAGSAKALTRCHLGRPGR